MLKTENVTFTHVEIDAASAAESIAETLRQTLVSKLRRRGFVIALSGGIDSSVTAALCARAVGPQRVFGLLMPEMHSAEESSSLGTLAAESLGISWEVRTITPMLQTVGCYAAQDEAIASVIPQYQPGYPFKIVLLPSSSGYRVFSLVVQLPDGTQIKQRMSVEAYLRLVAATNYKQRVRKMLEYYYADRLNYAVAGSPNRQEYDQGFFVKTGDGSADVKPIAHLYKSQVYALAEYLGIPDEIRTRPPTTDTYPMEQSQEEFYFALPYDKMDICLYAKNNGFAPESVCDATGLSVEQAAFVFRDIEEKRRATQYLHLGPQLAGEVGEVGFAHSGS